MPTTIDPLVDVESSKPISSAQTEAEADAEVRIVGEHMRGQRDQKFVAAVTRIQQKFLRRHSIELDRKLLLDRLRLEQKVWDGWFVFVNALILFVVVILVLIIGSVSQVRLEIQTSLERTLDLQKLIAIRTPAEFQDYLHVVSKRGRTMQPLSSDYFSDTEGTIKLLTGAPSIRGQGGTLRVRALPRIRSSLSPSAIFAFLRLMKLAVSFSPSSDDSTALVVPSAAIVC